MGITQSSDRDIFWFLGCVWDFEGDDDDDDWDGYGLQKER